MSWAARAAMAGTMGCQPAVSESLKPVPVGDQQISAAVIRSGANYTARHTTQSIAPEVVEQPQEDTPKVVVGRGEVVTR